jgi:hypothetical protein
MKTQNYNSRGYTTYRDHASSMDSSQDMSNDLYGDEGLKGHESNVMSVPVSSIIMSFNKPKKLFPKELMTI